MNIYDFYITPEEYELALKNGISKSTLEARIRKYGWSKYKALNNPVKKSNLEYWYKLAKSNGICKGTFMDRVYRLKWSLIKSASTPVMIKRNKKYPDWVDKLLARNGIKRTTFYNRVYAGWDIVKAATKKPMTLEETHKAFRRCNKKNM